MNNFNPKKISIIIPTKNEAEGLQKIIQSLKPFANEIIVVDGHSTDDTKTIVENEHATYILDHNRGRGEAVRLGIAAAHNDVIVFFDADGSHDEADIPRLVKPIMKGEVDLVIGSRRTGGSFDTEPTISALLRSAGSDVLTYLVNKRFNTAFTDILFSFRALKKMTAQKLTLNSNGFSLEQELLVTCLKEGYAIVEIPTREKKRAWGESKLKTITGIRLMLDLIKQLYL